MLKPAFKNLHFPRLAWTSLISTNLGYLGSCFLKTKEPIHCSWEYLVVLSSFLILGNTCKPLQLQQSRNKRGGGEGQGQGAAAPIDQLSQKKSSLRMDLFSLVSVILTVVTCNCLLFSCREIEAVVVIRHLCLLRGSWMLTYSKCTEFFYRF